MQVRHTGGSDGGRHGKRKGGREGGKDGGRVGVARQVVIDRGGLNKIERIGKERKGKDRIG